MKYRFKCMECKELYIFEFPVSEYDEKTKYLKCDKCEELLQRDVDDMCTSNYGKPMFYEDKTKSSNNLRIK